MNLSSRFLVPLLNVPQGLLNKYNYEVFVGDANYTKECWIDNKLFLQLSQYLGSDIESYLTKSNGFINSYQDSETGKNIYVKELTHRQMQEVVEPFLKGQYSQISRNYVNSYFSKFFFDALTNNFKPSWNYWILTKNEQLRKYWEEDKGLDLPENAEVWSRPLPKTEILNYKSDSDVFIFREESYASSGSDLSATRPSEASQHPREDQGMGSKETEGNY